MNIAQVCPYDINRPGGVQEHIRDTAATLQSLGHRVVILAPRMGADDPGACRTADGVEVIRIGRARKIFFGSTGYEIGIALGPERAALETLMRETPFDVMHFHTMWTPVLPFQIFLRSRAANVATFHDTAARTFTGFFLRNAFRAMSKLLLPRLDAAIAVSEAPMEHLRAARNQPVHILPPCTDLRRFAAYEPGPRRFGADRLNILFLGRLEERKGTMILLQAYRRLCADGLPVRLLIAGAGPEEAALRRYAAEHALPDVVFAGAFARADTPQWYAQADIVCAPSPYGESFGIVVAEAMASGKPVAAAANAGYRTLLKGEAARFLAPPGDADALYERLRDLARDGELRNRLGIWGRSEALRYDVRDVVPQIAAIYENAISKAGRRPSAAASAHSGG